MVSDIERGYNIMTREYILTHTPAEIAGENTAGEIRSEFDIYSPFDIDEVADRLFWSTDPEELADSLPDATFSRCEQLLTEWYDECEEERPCDAEALELTNMLYVALYVRWGMDVDD